VGVIVVKEC